MLWLEGPRDQRPRVRLATQQWSWAEQGWLGCGRSTKRAGGGMSQTPASWMQLFGSAALGRAKSKTARRGEELPDSTTSGFVLTLQQSDSRTPRKERESQAIPNPGGLIIVL